ncbi:hypothetical protein BgiMline_008444, partial [Biomphalaria glabrata]
ILIQVLRMSPETQKPITSSDQTVKVHHIISQHQTQDSNELAMFLFGVIGRLH